MSNNVPSRTEILGRATELSELIHKHVEWQEENRALHDDVVQGITDAGLMKLRVPLRYGGYEADTATVSAVIAELAKADGSVGWSMNTWSIGFWVAGLFPDEVQDEMFSDPEVRIGNSISPHGIATPTDGGYILNGKWPFCTGILHSQWFVHTILLAEGDNYLPAIATIPTSDLTVVDDWHTVGLRGTGSVSTVAENLFIPESHVVQMVPLLAEGKHRSEQNAGRPVWSTPFSPAASALACAVPLGMARAAQDAFFERLPGRKITYTDYESQNDAAVTHFQVAEAAVKLDEAAFHVERAADRVDAKAADGSQWNLVERAAARMDMGAAAARAKESVDILNTASGGSSIYTHQPIQRIERDIQTVNLHGAIHPNTNLELYGRILCGLEPNTHFI